MAYQVLSVVENWARDGSQSAANNAKYREALALLADAAKAVKAFN